MKKIRNEKNKDNVTPIELENERDESYTPDNPNIDLSRTGRNYHTVHRSERYMDYIPNFFDDDEYDGLSY